MSSFLAGGRGFAPRWHGTPWLRAGRHVEVAPGALGALAVNRDAASLGIRRQQRADDQAERDRSDVDRYRVGAVEEPVVHPPLGRAARSIQVELVAVELTRRVDGDEG